MLLDLLWCAIHSRCWINVKTMWFDASTFICTEKMTVFLEFWASMQNQNNSQQTFTSSKLRRSGVFIVNNRHTSHIFLVFLVYLMLTSSRISIVDYEQINVNWVSGLKTLPNFFMPCCNNVCNYCISIFLT